MARQEYNQSLTAFIKLTLKPNHPYANFTYKGKQNKTKETKTTTRTLSNKLYEKWGSGVS